ncbi:restriction endonuclease subunit S, partial [Acetobacter sp. DmW_125123]
NFRVIIMKKWPLSTISAVADVFDGPHATPKTIDHGAIFLGIDSLDHGRLNLSSTRHVTNEDFKKWTKRVKPEAGDIVFSYETRLGEVAIIPEGLVCCLGRRMALIRTDRSVLNEKFFLYYFMSPQFQEQIRKNTINGATVDRIPLKDFPSFKLELPPLDEQHTIASILGSLDDKIELNRRMNETLEAMVRAMFRDWFVDFGPTRTKMAGEAPYLAQELWELFPDRLDDEEKPAGWLDGTLEDIANLQNGYAFKSSDWLVDGIPVVKIGAVKPSVVDLKNVSFVDSKFLKEKQNFILKSGDILIGLTGYVGEVGRVPPSQLTPMLNQRVARFLPGPSFYAYIFCVGRQKEFKEFVENQAHGSAQANVSTKDVLTYPIVIPTTNLSALFDENVALILRRVVS